MRWKMRGSEDLRLKMSSMLKRLKWRRNENTKLLWTKFRKFKLKMKRFQNQRVMRTSQLKIQMSLNHSTLMLINLLNNLLLKFMKKLRFQILLKWYKNLQKTLTQILQNRLNFLQSNPQFKNQSQKLKSKQKPRKKSKNLSSPKYLLIKMTLKI